MLAAGTGALTWHAGTLGYATYTGQLQGPEAVRAWGQFGVSLAGGIPSGIAGWHHGARWTLACLNSRAAASTAASALQTHSILVGAEPRPIISQYTAGLGIRSNGTAIHSSILQSTSVTAISIMERVPIGSVLASGPRPRMHSPGIYSGNPAKYQKVPTGTPRSDGWWVERYYRMTPEDAHAYRNATADRISELHSESAWFSNEAAQRQYNKEQMSKFRTEWLQNFLKNRKY